MLNYFKRMIKFIIYGTPQVNTTASIGTLMNTNMLRNKRILITGGSRGIGKAIAKSAIEKGAEVVITGRNEIELKKVAKELGDRADYFVFDMENTSLIDTLLDVIHDKKINALVNNAGISLHEKSLFTVTQDDFEKQFRVNLEAPYFLSIRFVEYLIKNNVRGEIINIVSERGLYCDVLPYGLTKSALVSFTKGLARKCIKNNIRVNAVAPGVTATDMTGYKSTGNLYNPNSCGNRIFLPVEVAETVCFLLSDLSSSISGEIIACDQGNYLKCEW